MAYIISSGSVQEVAESYFQRRKFSSQLPYLPTTGLDEDEDSDEDSDDDLDFDSDDSDDYEED